MFHNLMKSLFCASGNGIVKNMLPIRDGFQSLLPRIIIVFCVFGMIDFTYNKIQSIEV